MYIYFLVLSSMSFSTFGWWREWNCLQIWSNMHTLKKKVLKRLKVKPISLMKLWKNWKTFFKSSTLTTKQWDTLDSSVPFMAPSIRLYVIFMAATAHFIYKGLCFAFLIIAEMILLRILSNAGNVYTESRKLCKLLHSIQPTFNGKDKKTKFHVIRSIYRTSGWFLGISRLGLQSAEKIILP